VGLDQCGEDVACRQRGGCERTSPCTPPWGGKDSAARLTREDSRLFVGYSRPRFQCTVSTGIPLRRQSCHSEIGTVVSISAKAYFELEVVEEDHDCSYGFASAAFVRLMCTSATMVGEDAHSSIVDGNNGGSVKMKTKTAIYNKEKDSSCPQYAWRRWKQSDVVGLACDLESMQLRVSVNGSFDTPNGVVFNLDPEAVCDSLFAAFSGSQGKLRYNLGETLFHHVAPSTD